MKMKPFHLINHSFYLGDRFRLYTLIFIIFATLLLLFPIVDVLATKKTSHIQNNSEGLIIQADRLEANNVKMESVFDKEPLIRLTADSTRLYTSTITEHIHDMQPSWMMIMKDENFVTSSVTLLIQQLGFDSWEYDGTNIIINQAFLKIKKIEISHLSSFQLNLSTLSKLVKPTKTQIFYPINKIESKQKIQELIDHLQTHPTHPLPSNSPNSTESLPHP